MLDPTAVRRPLLVTQLALLLALLAACAPATRPGDDASTSERPSRTDDPAAPVPPSSDTGAVGEVPEALLGQILADAAGRADVDADAIEVVSAEAVTWSDGSLDCPEPGMLYTQALVDGYHVVLDADGTELDYRATASGTYRLCENPGPPAGG